MNNDFIDMQKLYSSKENKKILKSKIFAMEIINYRKEKIDCAIVMYGKNKVIIPISEMGIEPERSKLRAMIGANIEFVVLGIDEISQLSIASRTKAMQIRKEISFKDYYENDIVSADVIAVFNDRIKVNCLGVDCTIRIDDLDYGYIQDISMIYHVGDKVDVLITSIDKENYKLNVSIKKLKKDPYQNIRILITEGGEYVGRVTGNAPTGIYVNLLQGVDVHVVVPVWLNKNLENGTLVSVRINRIDTKTKKIFGTLIKIIK